MFRGQSLVNEIHTLIEMKQQILLWHIINIEYLVVVDLIKIFCQTKNRTSGKKGLQELVTCKICLTLI